MLAYGEDWEYIPAGRIDDSAMVFGTIGVVRVYNPRLHSLVGWSPVITVSVVLTSFFVSVVSALVGSSTELALLKIALSFSAVLFAVLSTERVTRTDSVVKSPEQNQGQNPDQDPDPPQSAAGR